jgi:hypothetical protein
LVNFVATNYTWDRPLRFGTKEFFHPKIEVFKTLCVRDIKHENYSICPSEDTRRKLSALVEPVSGEIFEFQWRGVPSISERVVPQLQSDFLAQDGPVRASELTTNEIVCQSKLFEKVSLESGGFSNLNQVKECYMGKGTYMTVTNGHQFQN